MRKQLILFLLLMIPLITFGQNSIQNNTDRNLSDTTITALIFAEHHKLLIENDLLKEKITNYEKCIELYEQRDSVRREEIKIYEKQKKSTKRNVIYTSVGGVLLFILGLIL